MSEQIKARFQVAVVALDEDGNNLATLWPMDESGSQWTTLTLLELTDDERKVMASCAVGVLNKLRAHWLELAEGLREHDQDGAGKNNANE